MISVRNVWTLLVLAFASAAAVEAACPDTDTILRRLSALDLERGSRTETYGFEPPIQLYRKAAKNVGDPYSTRRGDKSQGAMIAPLPLAALWRALNDENVHDTDGVRIPVDHSEVIRGEPGGPDREVFQWAKMMGLGRWWVSRVWMNRDLFTRSGGKLWEVLWQDTMDRVDPASSPVDSISSKLSPIKSTRGVWLLARVDDSCTLIEYFNWSEPGGVIGVAQPIIIGKALRKTLMGVADLARLYEQGRFHGVDFLRPDGNPLP